MKFYDDDDDYADYDQRMIFCVFSMMMMMMVGVAYGGHMLVWNGNNLQYSTEYKVAGSKTSSTGT